MSTSPRDGQARLFREDGPPPEPDQETVEGTVRKTFTSLESGFRVVQVELDDGSRDVWVGVMPNLADGCRAAAVGVREHNPRHGLQLRVRTVSAVAPTTVEGIAEYLCSMKVPGLGPKLCARIVDKFGVGTLEVLEKTPDRVHQEVPGIGAEKAAALSAKWVETRVVGQIMVWLQGHGASPALATKIFQKYASRSIEIVSANPYQLALDVKGVGFKVADAIAARVGVSRTSPARAQAGTLHCLEQAMDNGHCFVATPDLTKAAARMLDLPGNAVLAAIDALTESGHVRQEGYAVFTRGLADAEAQLAARLLTLLRLPAVTGARIDVERAIRDYERSAKITLAPKQREAVRAAHDHKVVVITGGPGTGKTTITRGIIAMFEAMGLEVALASPTGRAAKRLSEATRRSAETIHRLLQWDPRERCFLCSAGNPVQATAVLIDEASMLDVELANSLADALPDNCRLVLVGDVDQLPSVGPGAVLRDVIASEVVPTVRLADIYRQAKGSSIIENAHRINRGERPQTSRDPDDDFFVVSRTDPQEAAAYAIELATKRLPAKLGVRPCDVRVLTPMRKGPAGTVALNARLQAVINPRGESIARGKAPHVVHYRVGDLVMQSRNDYLLDVFNGDVGTIVRIDTAPDGKRTAVVRMENDREVLYPEKALGALLHAYASTVHKAQGSQFAAVVVLMLGTHHHMLSRNLLYTAVTRGERMVVLVADPDAVTTALRETRREQRNTLLVARLREELDPDAEWREEDAVMGRHLVDDMEDQ